jgi:hypothetical protein
LVQQVEPLLAAEAVQQAERRAGQQRAEQEAQLHRASKRQHRLTRRLERSH